MKKSLMILLLLATVLSVSGSGSLALLTDSEWATNTFTADSWNITPIPDDFDVSPGDSNNSFILNSNEIILR